MREEEANWFPRWEEELPSPEELMPLSQTLITPDLALAFDIRNPNSSPQQQQQQNQSPIPISPGQLGGGGGGSIPSPPSQPHSSEFESAELGSGNLGDEPARTLKRPRLVWTPQLHKRFVDAVAHLGIKNAVPKTIMQLMSVDGLTRENVASHLQKYRLYLKRMQGLSAGGAGNGGGPLSAADAATDHLFASAPVPHHFLHPGRPAPGDHYLPFVPVLHHQQQMAAAAVIAAQQQQQQQQQYHHRQVGQFGSPPGGQFEHGFLTRQLPSQQPPPQPIHRIGGPVSAQTPNYVEDLGSATAGGGRKVLTLFPTGPEFQA
ncbi:hypothetical protein C5167_003377 [Papaver somniferum]|uniref:HTH myb-type domain-containing protein n=1 Tax=Papaver somniferum TaxID=3469 RepID=A0A4Y7L0U9_PAPSO|nr:hypothetical protein C5167_003377 [Papaver somniferum]